MSLWDTLSPPFDHAIVYAVAIQGELGQEQATTEDSQ
jgi:hypothetical protein